MTLMRLHGVYPFSAKRPTFALPIFVRDHVLIVQRPHAEDESKFSFETLSNDDIESGMIRLGVEVEVTSRIFAVVWSNQKINIGSVENISHKLTIISSGGDGVAIALQAAEILGLDSDRRSALGETAKLIRTRDGNRAATAFARSAALSVAWDTVQKSKIDIDTKRSVLDSLHLIRINLSGQNSIIDLSDIPERLRKFIDVNSITSQIRDEIVTPIRYDTEVEGDDGSYFDIRSEIPVLKGYLDRRLGIDRRMTASSYYRLLKLAGVMGVHGTAEIDYLVRDYNHNNISLIATGARQGQTGRVELMLMAAMGEEFIRRYPYNGNHWLRTHHLGIMRKLRDAGIAVGNRPGDHVVNGRFGQLRRPKPNLTKLSLFDEPTS